MYTVRGIAVDSCVTFDDECAITAHATGDQVELELSHEAGVLRLVTDEGGLVKMLDTARELHRRLCALPDGAPIDIEVP